jgi:transposase
MLNLPYCDTDCFQIFLNEFSNNKPDELKVVVLDNGAFHKAKRLKIPKNIVLIFLPPYSPELNPAEKMWQKIKRNFTNRIFKTLNEVELFICEQSKNTTRESVMSICGYDYIFLSSIWSHR